ncbi:hypothetical protein C6T66_19770 [Burkholderia multivorans]|uniref:Uncharacterized protein n=2 Tax=Burkholderia multivorans TaxID=87883 RepID=B9BQ91_9BURK|nr:conserved hypothetical protein [Burkholderia multivorans CGD2]EEE13272.1 conserved hypothetical protein [Burkholderia multivorans CGD2M]PRD89976.1 hypothetical protein C6P76_04815 [Burkholderia multivorans]PRE62104.1 hypothetical protein C6P86_20515 [Burkholderia multivorans]PRE87099.1 hypothetical protein C6Q00_11815 [Burkholderia multivorans]
MIEGGVDRLGDRIGHGGVSLKRRGGDIARQAGRACAHHISEVDGAAARRAAPLWRLGPVRCERRTPGRADSVRRECRRKGPYCSTVRPSVRDNAANGRQGGSPHACGGFADGGRPASGAAFEP